MAELTLAYKAKSYSTGTLGRAICNARNHHWVADDPGGDEVGAGELFFSGITACAVNMVERIANSEDITLDWMEVEVESYRDPEKAPGEITLYDAIRVQFEMWGVDDDQAFELVETWKRR
jgi:uncharacterized OsmC-like protein